MWWMPAPWTLGPYRLVGVSSMAKTSRSPASIRPGDDLQQGGGDLLRLAADRVEEVVIGPEARADPGGLEPTGCGPPARGEQDSGEDGGPASRRGGHAGGRPGRRPRPATRRSEIRRTPSSLPGVIVAV